MSTLSKSHSCWETTGSLSYSQVTTCWNARPFTISVGDWAEESLLHGFFFLLSWKLRRQWCIFDLSAFFGLFSWKCKFTAPPMWIGGEKGFKPSLQFENPYASLPHMIGAQCVRACMCAWVCTRKCVMWEERVWFAPLPQFKSGTLHYFMQKRWKDQGSGLHCWNGVLAAQGSLWQCECQATVTHCWATATKGQRCTISSSNTRGLCWCR